MELSSDESKILVIYTGGTIGMLTTDSGGYSPEPNFLIEFLRAQARFHDPLQDSLFSNSGSSHTFREWSNSNSGRTTPVTSQYQPTLPVKTTRPVGFSSGLMPAGAPNSIVGRSLISVPVSENVYESNLPSLVTPRSSSGQGGKRIRYAILEVCSFQSLSVDER